MPCSRLFFSLLAYLLIITALSSQTLDHRQGELIVRLAEKVDGKTWAATHTAIHSYERLSVPLNTWLLKFDFEVHHLEQLRANILWEEEVISCQPNRLVSLRAIPNDQLFGQQWQHRNVGQSGGLVNADFDSELAWDVTTGGTTVNGDTIVVCVIDNGIDIDHPDLVNQLWINRDEIPGNGVDDDNNGYIDDVQGWDTAFESNDVDGGAHGTSVSGIVGAQGNNNIGVSGMAWDIQIMMVRNRFNTAESEVIQAYSYALEARMRYDETGGAEGAYVVATNASWGLTAGQPADSPIWCDLYDVLGVNGILNMGATANQNLDIDAVGDLPTACPSDFLISVTNLNDNDQKVTAAGFGSNTIDIGAYGEEAFTTTIGGGYGSFAGTSAATPAVSGAVGLLYSAPCAAFGELLESDPAGAALLIKDIILNSATPNASLSGITTSGGRLNVNNAMQALMALCDNCLPPSSQQITLNGAFGVSIDWSTINSVTEVELRYRLAGSNDWITLADVTPPLAINSLESCSTYEYQLLVDCDSNAGSSPISTFTTDGCCSLPPALSLEVLSPSAVSINWSEVLAAVNYDLRYRVIGAGQWIDINSSNGDFLLTNLQACTDYELQIRSDCDTSQTAFGLYQQFSTSGCGVCLDANYCSPPQLNNNSEWIAGVNLGNLLEQFSEAEPMGYRNFGFGLEAPTLAQGGVYPFIGTPDYSGTQFSEEFKVWIDFDQNGFFTSNEIVVEVNAGGGDDARGDILVPEGAALGLTRMRVVMEFSNVNSACPVTSRTGEMEDYCVEIIESPGCVPPDNIWIGITDDLVSVINWTSSSAVGGDYVLRYRLLGTNDWTSVDVTGNSYELDLSDQCAVFELQIASKCNGSVGDFSTTGFNSCTSIGNPGEDLIWSMSPNPAREFCQLQLGADERGERVDIIDFNGRQLATYNWPGGDRFSLPVKQLPAGVYLIRLQTEQGRLGIQRLIVQ